ncbi:DegQ family serine endoprotease [soil metagenome]
MHTRQIQASVLAALLLAPAQLAAQSTPAVVRDQLGSDALADTATALALSSAFRAAAERTLPAVVFIVVEQSLQAPSRDQMEQIPEPLREFFRVPPQERQRQGTGSGFIIDAQGHILTNTHVVAEATRLTVRLVDGREYTARVVGSDMSTDIAVIKIEPRPGEILPTAPLGDSEPLRVGDWVLALGSPLGLDFTVTAGIVSAKGRQISGNLESFIQTDAVINPGNSGGPLIDLFGRVIGVNSAIFGSDRFVGYGFAVPVNLARRVTSDLLEHGYLRRPMIGASVRAVAAVDAEIYALPEVRGALVAGVTPDGPAAQAGLRPGDVVVSLNNGPIRDDTHFITSLADLRPGQRVSLGIVRERRPQNVSVELGEFPRPAPPAAAPVDQPELPEHVLGFAVRDITPRDAQRVGYAGEGGVVVSEVQQFGPAATARIQRGAIILAINGQRVRNAQQVRNIASGITPGNAVSLLAHDAELREVVINYRTRQ